jgi:hypothetical protein
LDGFASLYASQHPGGNIFNKVASTAGQQGDFGRNMLRGFGATQADLGLQRQFQLTEKMGLRFRSEFFNLFNHLNFGNPNNTLNSPLFGRSTQTLASGLGSGGANGGFTPPSSDRRPALHPARPQTPILSNASVLIGNRPYSSLLWPFGTFTVSAKLQISARQNCRR